MYKCLGRAEDKSEPVMLGILGKKSGHALQCFMEDVKGVTYRSISCHLRESQQRWCNTCQIHFTGDLIKHRRTQEHKVTATARVSSL